MRYTIIWSRFSENQIDEIYNYYETRVNIKLAKKIIKSILSAPDQLIKNPKIGALESLLKNREIEYRYIVSTNYKIVYSVEELDKSVRIADVFDTRQNPNKIEQRVKLIKSSANKGLCYPDASRESSRFEFPAERNT